MSCIVTLGCAGFKCYCTWSHQLGVGNSGGHSAALPPGGAIGAPRPDPHGRRGDGARGWGSEGSCFLHCGLSFSWGTKPPCWLHLGRRQNLKRGQPRRRDGARELGQGNTVLPACCFLHKGTGRICSAFLFLTRACDSWKDV